MNRRLKNARAQATLLASVRSAYGRTPPSPGSVIPGTQVERVRCGHKRAEGVCRPQDACFSCRALQYSEKEVYSPDSKAPPELKIISRFTARIPLMNVLITGAH